MALKTFVKVGNITNLSDARYCAGMGVDLLGFSVVEGQPQFIESKLFQEIRGWVTGPSVVAEIYGLQHASDLDKILENYKPDYLEMGAAELALFDSLPLPFIVSVRENDELPNLPLHPSYVIQHGQNVNPSAYPTLLVLESKEDLNVLLDNPHVKGVVLNGTAEIKPGLKDFEAMADILEQLEVD
ncbi:hypothetical protein [Chryseolinea lacunae]|uniref:Phosphoribosylanthranilate isomerase n=1 Tax=Chryseolinea lacunae TaxID=2801331 RepID=A0ABS1L081_9BACT|nr:hypothetical protein [Chryseolinea lacunae]MBL0744912.1 hypothetical protein [Chryseolinea lacunae]